MVYNILILTFTFTLSYSTFAQTNEEQNKGFKCQQSWKYRNLEKSTKGTIIFHKKPSLSCGIMSVASVSIIKTDNGNIIRVLELCNTEKDFPAGSYVYIEPESKPSFHVDWVPYDTKACIILETYFGALTKK